MTLVRLERFGGTPLVVRPSAATGPWVALGGKRRRARYANKAAMTDVPIAVSASNRQKEAPVALETCSSAGAQARPDSDHLDTASRLQSGLQAVPETLSPRWRRFSRAARTRTLWAGMKPAPLFFPVRCYCCLRSAAACGHYDLDTPRCVALLPDLSPGCEPAWLRRDYSRSHGYAHRHAWVSTISGTSICNLIPRQRRHLRLMAGIDTPNPSHQGTSLIGTGDFQYGVKRAERNHMVGYRPSDPSGDVKPASSYGSIAERGIRGNRSCSTCV